MPYRIITISRAPYSGARHIARLVADKLNLAYYDKELITLAAKESGLSEEAIAASETQRSSSLLYSLSTLGSQLPLADQVYLVKSSVIKQVAEEGPCVIVGCCGDYVLNSRKDVLNVFLYGSEDLRVAQARPRACCPPTTPRPSARCTRPTGKRPTTTSTTPRTAGARPRTTTCA